MLRHGSIWSFSGAPYGAVVSSHLHWSNRSLQRVLAAAKVMSKVNPSRTQWASVVSPKDKRALAIFFKLIRKCPENAGNCPIALRVERGRCLTRSAVPFPARAT